MYKVSGPTVREIHYVCDSGRVEGLILNKDEEGDTDHEREPQERPCNRCKIPGQWEGGGAHAQQGLGGGHGPGEGAPGEALQQR